MSEPRTQPEPERPERPILPDRPREDEDDAWGDRESRRDRDWYERERPPHH